MQHYYILQLVNTFFFFNTTKYLQCTYYTFYTFSGASDDWAKGVAKIKYAYTIELRDTGKYGFILPPSEILTTGKEAFVAVSTLASEINSQYDSKNNNE